MCAFSNNCFYPYSLKDSYELSGTWPSSFTQVSDEVFIEFTSIIPEGKMVGTDSNGMPVWVDIPPKTNEELLSAEITNLSILYKSDISDLNTSYLAAIVSDGPSEITKQQVVRDQITQRKAQYTADIAAAKEKYPV